ncbi:hypothetical protein GQ600_5487 [Phytophthora cactorum]|nr:hypothetical protein GQ600_5487 [Phytophthora cactorum]
MGVAAKCWIVFKTASQT